MLKLEDVIILLLVLLGSCSITYFYKRWAIKRSILDIPNERSSHESPVPRGGGIAIVVVFYVYLLYAFLTYRIEKSLFFALIPGIVLAVIGFIDDFRSISPAIRILVQIICAAVALYFLSGFSGLFWFNLRYIWSILMILGIVWFVNLFNFLDGSDGYASMEAIFVAVSLWLFSKFDVLLVLSFSVIGFLIWNWPKAKIFMGDVGSTVLGFVLAVLGVYLHNESMLFFHFWIVLTALFWFDATLTLFRRITKREKLSQAHKKHIYQRAIQLGFSHQMILFIGLIINLLLLSICYIISKNYFPWSVGYFIAILILWIVMKYVDRRVPHK